MPPSKRVKKPKPPPSYTPWNCAILAVDPGERSGWSLWFNGSLIDWGECDAFFGAPAEVINGVKFFHWLTDDDTKQPPLIVVVERPFRTQYGTQVAVGAGDLVWRRAAEAAGLKSRIVRVYPSTWRSKALPKGWAGGAKAKRASVKEIELAEAWKIVSCKKPSKWDRPNVTVGSESAPAILIGKWATHAGEVGAKMPRPRKKRAA